MSVQVSVLHQVFCFGTRGQHAIGNAKQAGSMINKALQAVHLGGIRYVHDDIETEQTYRL